MATSKNTIQQSRITGALAGLNALRKLEQAAKTISNIDDTPQQYYDKRLTDTRALVAALGPMSPELKGAIAVLAEYVHMGITTGRPNLEPGGWVPMATMTEAGRQAMIERTDAEQAAENDEGVTV